jgi:hypothetical protein
MGNITVELHIALVTALVRHVRGGPFAPTHGVPGEALHQELGYIGLHFFQPVQAFTRVLSDAVFVAIGYHTRLLSKDALEATSASSQVQDRGSKFCKGPFPVPFQPAS